MVETSVADQNTEHVWDIWRLGNEVCYFVWGSWGKYQEHGGKGWGWSKQLPDVEESQEPCHILTHNARLVKSPQEVRSGFLTPPLSWQKCRVQTGVSWTFVRCINLFVKVYGSETSESIQTVLGGREFIIGVFTSQNSEISSHNAA